MPAQISPIPIPSDKRLGALAGGLPYCTALGPKAPFGDSSLDQKQGAFKSADRAPAFVACLVTQHPGFTRAQVRSILWHQSGGEVPRSSASIRLVCAESHSSGDPMSNHMPDARKAPALPAAIAGKSTVGTSSAGPAG